MIKGLKIALATTFLVASLLFFANRMINAGGFTEGVPQSLSTTSAVTFATVNTGQGANELYDMNQNVQTTDAVTFKGLTLTYGVAMASATATGTAGITISSATTSGTSMNFIGAYETLPTTGYSEGTLAYQTSDHKLYVSTETVSIAQSWVALH